MSVYRIQQIACYGEQSPYAFKSRGFGGEVGVVTEKNTTGNQKNYLMNLVPQIALKKPTTIKAVAIKASTNPTVGRKYQANISNMAMIAMSKNEIFSSAV